MKLTLGRFNGELLPPKRWTGCTSKGNICAIFQTRSVHVSIKLQDHEMFGFKRFCLRE
jgi:hypothetical protein